ncbi:hypothetical protein NDU88_011434 [Pleurodeles waltl]|uniref:Uncharacterized protein n=1 Tax=Pleurodeles waltl TaxID=8319 RepID=A0AAV7R0C1_PLEWA|nr:hypothetical protein NDU88_011434 [Pleurodeles waltl]
MRTGYMSACCEFYLLRESELRSCYQSHGASFFISSFLLQRACSLSSGRCSTLRVRVFNRPLVGDWLSIWMVVALAVVVPLSNNKPTYPRKLPEESRSISSLPA